MGAGLAKMEISDRAMAPMIRYWVLKARSALLKAMPNSSANTARSTASGGRLGATHSRPSRKPKMYMATPRGRVRNSGMPIAPPTSSPRDLFMIA